VVAAVRSARRDRRTAAIVLYVNSPGGSALASELILDEVRRAAKKKPVIAYFDRVAASGGYMAALGASEIWAAPGAIAGSIGVFGGKFELSGLLDRLGLRRMVITRGDNAGMFSLSRPFTPHERATIELEIEEAYQDFLEQVARARGKTKEEIHARGEGRVYSGDEALKAGLIDRTGGFEEACRRALELARSPSERFEVLIHPTARRRLAMLGWLREAQAARIFALWLPGLEWRRGADEDRLEEHFR
jgi:protease-4